ncbi:MAG TPA: transposase [Alphaproteobacteria bacterium]|nr:transposase [Alphaproteobacteria bacterium]HJM50557.1 transposase [Alphaproteobacteria bacterium]
MPYWQQQRNNLIAPIRANVERIFGTMKRSYGYAQARDRGLERNGAHLQHLCIAINVRRAEKLTA